VDRNKEEWREYMASLSFSEKVKILERLRERSCTIAAAGLRKQAPPDCAGPEKKKTVQ